jgi:hypothetical protein
MTLSKIHAEHNKIRIESGRVCVCQRLAIPYLFINILPLKHFYYGLMSLKALKVVLHLSMFRANVIITGRKSKGRSYGI